MKNKLVAQTMKNEFSVALNDENGLRLTWSTPDMDMLSNIPVRVRIRGTHIFRIWGHDSGEGAPVWSEPDLDIELFGKRAEIGSRAETDSVLYSLFEVRREGLVGYRAKALHQRVAATVDILMDDGELTISLSIENPQPLGGFSFPLCQCELEICDISVPPESVFHAAHPYQGNEFAFGPVNRLGENGVHFHHGCIGLGLPLAYLYNQKKGNGLQFEFMMEGRPAFRFRQGALEDSCTASLSWGTERLLHPGQVHPYGGKLRLKPLVGTPVAAMRDWRDNAREKYGLAVPATPNWARHANFIEINLDPANKTKPFVRMDDPEIPKLMKRWKDMGYTAIFAESHNHTIAHFLSPLDYLPREECGGLSAEGAFLDCAHKLGFHVILWVTTVGVDKHSPLVAANPQWWTHRVDGSLFYAWSSNEANGFEGYAPDAEPMSNGWRNWLKNQVKGLVDRGFDGIFVDGLIPRASNHERYDWPGQSRDAVPDQVLDLAKYLRTLRDDLLLLVEDEALQAQTGCEMTMGRYHAMAPFFYDGSTQFSKRIPPGMARDFLLTRYASLLPDVVSNDVIQTYYSHEAFPWTVQSLLAGCVPKTFSHMLDYGQLDKFVENPLMGTPPIEEQSADCRRAGNEVLLALLRLCRDEPLLREAPLSIEGVVVTGDQAVVGMIRPDRNKAILGVMQFADRASDVEIRLCDPCDVTIDSRQEATEALMQEWQVREILCSMQDIPSREDNNSLQDSSSLQGNILSASLSILVSLAPYGFRIFELQRWGSFQERQGTGSCERIVGT